MLKPKQYPTMTKDKLKFFTFAALLAIAVISVVLWSQITPVDLSRIDPVTNKPISLMNLGLTAAIVCAIAVAVAVGVDQLLSNLISVGSSNLVSSAIFGLIVALSYSLGVPALAQDSDVLPKALLSAPQCFVYVAVISFIGQVIFVKFQGLAKRNYVNPVAAAKLLVLLPFTKVVFLAKDHYATFSDGGLSAPRLAGPIGSTVIGENGLVSFTSYLQSSYGSPLAKNYTDLNQLLILQKFHGWIGGASSIAVIIIGIALFVLAREYVKWKITAAYFVTIIITSMLLSAAYGDGDLTTRLLFEVFIGSSIFLAFFMATDPSSTPLTQTGQLFFGIGLGTFTVLIQTYMNFFGGSLLALVVMNLTTPALDKIEKRIHRQNPIDATM